MCMIYLQFLTLVWARVLFLFVCLVTRVVNSCAFTIMVLDYPQTLTGVVTKTVPACSVFTTSRLIVCMFDMDFGIL